MTAQQQYCHHLSGPALQPSWLSAALLISMSSRRCRVSHGRRRWRCSRKLANTQSSWHNSRQQVLWYLPCQTWTCTALMLWTCSKAKISQVCELLGCLSCGVQLVAAPSGSLQDQLLPLLMPLVVTLAAATPSAQHIACLQAGWSLRSLRSCFQWRQGSSSPAASRAALTHFRGTQVHRLVQDLAAFSGQTKE